MPEGTVVIRRNGKLICEIVEDAGPDDGQRNEIVLMEYFLTQQASIPTARALCPLRNRIHAIKWLRNITGCGLKEAKDAVDQAWPQIPGDQKFDLDKAIADSQAVYRWPVVKNEQYGIPLDVAAKIMDGD